MRNLTRLKRRYFHGLGWSFSAPGQGAQDGVPNYSKSQDTEYFMLLLF